MDWGRVALAVLASGLASSMTDWLFAGSLFHGKYNAYPEVWRYPAGAGERRAVLWSIVAGFFACAAFTLIVVSLGMHGWGETLLLALLVWAAAALPVLITNALFIKLHPLVVLSNALGWLVKLGLAAAAVVLIVR
jgi:hypothetical protein